MKITISHDQDSIDPNATYSDKDFVAVRETLESHYEAALMGAYPTAEIDFSGTDTTYGVRVTDLEDNYSRNTIHEDWINHILGDVYDTGLFWL